MRRSRVALWTACLLIPACGDDSRDAFGTDDGGEARDRRGSDGGWTTDARDDSIDGSAPSLAWSRVGPLEYWPDDRSDLVLYGPSIVSPSHDASWDVTTAQRAHTPFSLAQNVSFRQDGCSCGTGTHAYVLGGGGDGVTAPWADYSFVDTDLATRTATSLPTNWEAHGTACAAANGLCYVLGGWSSEVGPYGSTGVRAFNPASAVFTPAAPLPTPSAYAAVAVGAGKIVVAGGFCSGGGACPPKNDPGGDYTVLTTVYSADEGDIASWQAQAPLPRPITGGSRFAAGMAFVSGRFYLVGGSASVVGVVTQNGVISWAPGENAWRADGAQPGPSGSTVAEVFTDGTELLVVIYDAQKFEYDLYRANP